MGIKEFYIWRFKTFQIFIWQNGSSNDSQTGHFAGVVWLEKMYPTFYRHFFHNVSLWKKSVIGLLGVCPEAKPSISQITVCILLLLFFFFSMVVDNQHALQPPAAPEWGPEIKSYWLILFNQSILTSCSHLCCRGYKLVADILDEGATDLKVNLSQLPVNLSMWVMIIVFIHCWPSDGDRLGITEFTLTLTPWPSLILLLTDLCFLLVIKLYMNLPLVSLLLQTITLTSDFLHGTCTFVLSPVQS